MYKKYFVKYILLLSVWPFMGCGTTYKTIIYDESARGTNYLEIHEGIVSQHAQRIKYMRGGKKVATITLFEPVMVAMAEQEEKWG